MASVVDSVKGQAGTTCKYCRGLDTWRTQSFFFSKIFFEKEWERQSMRGKGEKQQTPHWARSRMRDLIPGPWDHDLSRRQTLNQLSHPGAPHILLVNHVLKNVDINHVIVTKYFSWAYIISWRYLMELKESGLWGLTEPTSSWRGRGARQGPRVETPGQWLSHDASPCLIAPHHVSCSLGRKRERLSSVFPDTAFWAQVCILDSPCINFAKSLQYLDPNASQAGGNRAVWSHNCMGSLVPGVALCTQESNDWLLAGIKTEALWALGLWSSPNPLRQLKFHGKVTRIS